VGSYGELWKKTVNPGAGWVLSLVMFIDGFLCLCSYMIIIASQVLQSAGVKTPMDQPPGGTWGMERLYVVLGAGLVCGFLSMFKQLKFLKYPSMLGIVATLYCFVFMGVDWVSNGYAFQGTGGSAYDSAALGKGFDALGSGIFSQFMVLPTLSGLSIGASAYLCHYNAPRLFKELAPEHQTAVGFLKIAAGGFGIAIVFFVFFGVFGVGRLGVFVGGGGGNVLNVIGEIYTDGYTNGLNENRTGKGFADAAWLGIAFSVAVSYPLILNPTRAEFFNLWRQMRGSDGTAVPDVGASANRAWFLTITGVLLLTTIIVGWWGVNLGLVVEIKGCTTSVFLSSIAPFYMRAGEIRGNFQAKKS